MTISTTLTKTHTQVGVTNRKDTHSVCVCVCVGWKGEHQKSIKRSSDFYPRVRSLFCFVQSIPKKISFSLYISSFLLLLLLYLRFPFPISFFIFKDFLNYFLVGEKERKKRKFLKLQRPAPMAVYVCACLV